jgi:hypothetical protein
MPFLLLALQVLAQASGRKNCLVHIMTSGENFDCNEGEHGCFHLQTKLRTLYRVSCVGEF